MMRLRRIVVALSGGVDSAVSALILKKRGYEPLGVFMRNWDAAEESGACSVEQDAEDAQFVCKKIGMPFQEVNFVKEYWNEVFSNLVTDYENGLTPNPDILCNKKIKFQQFLNYALENIGADAIATGHYARTSFGEDMELYNPRKGVRLLRAVDRLKDQTFFLAQVNQPALQRTLFPVGDLTKDVVKKIAVQSGMERIAKRKETTGICFVGPRSFRDFIAEYVPVKPGRFIDLESGTVIGEHDGVHQWTIGQRCRIGGLAQAYFVLDKNPGNQDIIVVAGEDHPALYTKSVFTGRPHWIHSPPKALFNSDTGTLECDFCFQHQRPVVPCSVSIASNSCLVVHLRVPLRAVTPGQYGVFYKGDECLGSARILRPGPSLYALKERREKKKVLLDGLDFNFVPINPRDKGLPRGYPVESQPDR